MIVTEYEGFLYFNKISIVLPIFLTFVVSVLLMKTYFSFHGTRNDLYQDLLAQGVNKERIDAGFEINQSTSQAFYFIDNIQFIDLILYKPKNLNEIYLKCDGHWSPKGNLWAAKIISKHLNKN